ncbi:MAG TPA: FkbM family methyltransferase [Vicinamibacterales bacterium]|nr:FkbM family methyltransferase [Vicinamibacterales bacterium]
MSAIRSTYRRMRWAVHRAIGRDVRFPVQTRVRSERHGSDAGEWWICPDGLGPSAIVYSFGIGTDITFDLSLIRAYGLTVHAFDPTPGAIAYVERQQLPPGFEAHSVGVASRDGRATFFPPENPSHISHTLLRRPETSARAIEVEVRRLSTIMRELRHESIDVLKMDIEGAEYEVLDEILDRGLAVRQILVEFHHRFPAVGIDRTRQAVRALNEAGYKIFFAAESGEEYSFIRQD